MTWHDKRECCLDLRRTPWLKRKRYQFKSSRSTKTNKLIRWNKSNATSCIARMVDCKQNRLNGHSAEIGQRLRKIFTVLIQGTSTPPNWSSLKRTDDQPVERVLARRNNMKIMSSYKQVKSSVKFRKLRLITCFTSTVHCTVIAIRKGSGWSSPAYC